MEKLYIAFELQNKYSIRIAICIAVLYTIYKSEVIKMAEIPKYYTRLFNGVTDAIEALEHMRYSEGLQLLIKAQQDAEELYINEEENSE